MSLLEQVEGYISTLDYQVSQKTEDFLIASKVGIGCTEETSVFWVPEIPGASKAAELEGTKARLAKQFEEISGKYQEAKKFFIASSFADLGEVLTAAKQNKVATLSPVSFFDTEFKQQTGTGGREFKRKIQRLLKDVHRIPQPYSMLDEDYEVIDKGDDLLETLIEQASNKDSHGVRIIIGPAGIGKTWLFNRVFKDLYNRFQESKRKQEKFRRPIPITAEDRMQESGTTIVDGNIESLLENFIRNDISSPSSVETLRWSVENGYSMWMFDGLDELYTRDVLFFEELLDVLTDPVTGGDTNTALVFVFARSSLLSTSENLYQFISGYASDASDSLRIFRLEPWGKESKKSFSDLFFTDRSRGKQFFSLITSKQPLVEISRLPFYCNLLRKNFESGSATDFYDKFQLLEHVIEEMVEREKGKGVFEGIDIGAADLSELLQLVAVDTCMDNRKGISKKDFESYILSALPVGVTAEEESRMVTAMMQFPLFTASTELDHVAFAHELLAEYLTGKYYYDRIATDPRSTLESLSKIEDFRDSLAAEWIVKCLSEDRQTLESMMEIIEEKQLAAKQQSLLLDLVLKASENQDGFEQLPDVFEGLSLRGIGFRDRDMEGLSFRNCDLEYAVFDGCNLRGAHFEGAHFKHTGFENIDSDSLRGATFGNLMKFESAKVGKKTIEDRHEFHSWLSKLTECSEDVFKPCPTAEQLRELFKKYIRADGSPRRYKLRRDVLEKKGRVIKEAKSRNKILQHCIGSGYLVDTGFHDYVSRATGARYDEMVYFVRDWRLSEGLRHLLGRICNRKDCIHVPNRADGSYAAIA